MPNKPTDALLALAERAVCCGCNEAIPLTAEQIMVSGTKGWWHSECHDIAQRGVNRWPIPRTLASQGAE